MARPYKRELAYLEGTGTQWIDTLAICSGNVIKITGNVLVPQSTGYLNAILGAWDGSNRSCMLFEEAGFLRYDVGTSANMLKVTLATNVKASFSYTTDNTTNTYDAVINSTVYSGSYSGVNGNNRSLYLFSINHVSATYIGKMRIYDIKIVIDNAAVRDFIPILDNNDVPCMYDRVSKQLFYNQGTGTFLYGEKPAVVIYNPIPYRMNPLSAGFSPSELTFTARQAGSTVTLNKTGSPNVSGLQYKTKSLDWTIVNKG